MAPQAIWSERSVRRHRALKARPYSVRQRTQCLRYHRQQLVKSKRLLHLGFRGAPLTSHASTERTGACRRSCKRRRVCRALAMSGSRRTSTARPGPETDHALCFLRPVRSDRGPWLYLQHRGPRGLQLPLPALRARPLASLADAGGAEASRACGAAPDGMDGCARKSRSALWSLRSSVRRACSSMSAEASVPLGGLCCPGARRSARSGFPRPHEPGGAAARGGGWPRPSRWLGSGLRWGLPCQHVITCPSAVLPASGRYLLSFVFKMRTKVFNEKKRYSAMTYSPTPLPGQYHRRWWA